MKSVLADVRCYARRFGANDTLTLEQITELYRKASGICHYCKNDVGEELLWPDHVIPLSEFGDNSIANIVLSCGVCNRRKMTYNKPVEYKRKPCYFCSLEGFGRIWSYDGINNYVWLCVDCWKLYKLLPRCMQKEFQCYVFLYHNIPLVEVFDETDDGRSSFEFLRNPPTNSVLQHKNAESEDCENTKRDTNQKSPDRRRRIDSISFEQAKARAKEKRMWRLDTSKDRGGYGC